MKKILLIIATIFTLTTAQGQQFSFQMFFSDAIGNKDTITLGYDLLATDSIDIAFGETNIISTQFGSGLDVRITNEWRNRVWFNRPGTYHTKKQIIFGDCSKYAYDNVQSIDIYTKNWPVTVAWDKTLFSDSCRIGSVFTSVNPGGWWDTGSPSDLGRIALSQNKSVTFSSNTFREYNESYGYIKATDTIPVFWQAFADISLLYSSLSKMKKTNNELKVFPNPSKDNFSIQVPEEYGAIKSVQIFSTLGLLTMTTNKAFDIDISQLNKGLYLIVITNDIGEKRLTRIMKE